MSWQGIKTQLGEVKDAYLDPLFDRPDSAEEILQKIKNKELGIEWWEEETRKLNALKNLIPEKRQQQVGSILSQAGEMFDTAWKGAETVENWYDPFDVGAAGAAHTVNLFNKGVGLLSQGVAAGLHHGARIHKPAADLGGNVASVVLTKKLMAGTGNLLRSGQLSQAARNILPTSRLNPASGKVVKVASTPVHGLPIGSETSASVLRKGGLFSGPGGSGSTIVKESQALARAVAGKAPSGGMYAFLATEPVTTNSSLLGDAIATVNPDKRHWLYRQDETAAIVQRNNELNKLAEIAKRQGKKINQNDVRDILAKPGSHVIKHFDTHPSKEIRELKEPFLKHYSQRANLITKYDTMIKHVLGIKGLGIDTNTGHIISLKGDPKLLKSPITPTTPMGNFASDLAKYPEESGSNIQHGEKNLFSRETIALINRASTQMEEAQNFILNRPDLKGWTLEDEIREGIKLNRLARKEITPEALEIEEMVELDLKKAGILDTSKDKIILKEILIDMYKKNLIRRATDPLELLRQGKIKPSDHRLQKDYFSATAGRRLKGTTIRTRERQDTFRQPVIDEIIKEESKLKKLPSEATGK